MSKKREAPPKPEELISKLEVKFNEFKEEVEAKKDEQEKINQEVETKNEEQGKINEEVKVFFNQLQSKLDEIRSENNDNIAKLSEQNKEAMERIRDELMEAIKVNTADVEVVRTKVTETTGQINDLEKQNKDKFEEMNLKLEQKIDNLNGKFFKNMENLSGQMESESSFNERTKEQINILFSRVDDIHEKLYEFEVNKKNNLIFYGISGEHRETPSQLMAKITAILKQTLSLRRDIVISKAARIMTGKR